MDIRNRPALKQLAHERLAQQTYSPGQLALIHAGIASAVLLVITALNFFLSQQVETTAGLSGMGLRSVLQTAQMVLQYASSILLPFWQIGFIFTAIGMARGVQVHPRDLAEGFRKFRPALGLMLLRGLLYGLMAIPCMYLSSIVYTFTPAGRKMMEQLIPLMESGADMAQLQTALLEQSYEQFLSTLWPVFVIFLVIYGLVAVTMFYRFRFADHLVMDNGPMGAWRALAQSSRITRKHRLTLLRLDLSFWWYYALLLLTMLISNADLLLGYLAVELPLDPGLLYLLTYALGLGAQVLLFAFAGSHMHTTIAAAYDSLLQQSSQQPKPTAPELPWQQPNA